MVCSAAPGQVAPFTGAGLVQVRVWVSVPPPQDLVHVVLLAHGDQAPSTVVEYKIGHEDAVLNKRA
jgi:hypothetical protein